MTPFERHNLRELLAKVTPGPWRVYGAHGQYGIYSEVEKRYVILMDDDCTSADIRFMVAARQAVPWLLDRVDRLNKDVESLVASIEKLQAQLQGERDVVHAAHRSRPTFAAGSAGYRFLRDQIWSAVDRLLLSLSRRARAR